MNIKLLFIPEELIRYAMLHELCHTIHMNHSAKFWALLSDHEHAFKTLDAKLRTAWRSVPAWLDVEKMTAEI